MAKVIWSPRALADIDSIRDYIGQSSPLAAQRMAIRLLQAGDSLDLFPRRGRPAARGMRELTVIYPYIIRYRVVGERVDIVRIKHGAQRPSG